MSLLTTKRTIYLCWKCGQPIRHQRLSRLPSDELPYFVKGRRCSRINRWWQRWRGRGKQTPMVPIRHLVEKAGHYEECVGSLRPVR